MSFRSLSLLSLLALATAQSPTTTGLTPLTSKKVSVNNIPFQVTGDNGGIRGPQSGYNLCNATTEGQNSQCQTAFLNDITDFCMWSSNMPASNNPTDTVGASEAREVAWCTKPGHGTRVIPPGTITGAQWLYAKNYLQVVGFLDQSKVNLDPTDMGGELDPHGADEQGNPLGGLVFSSGFGMNANSFAQSISGGGGSNNATPIQVIEWIDFIGSGIFCLKMCNPSDPNAPQLCNHIYDEIGCNYNAIADYNSINGTFEVCDSDDMTPPGIFTTAPGQTTTWFQPQTGPVIPPYSTQPVSSSNCHTFASTQLWAAAVTAFPSSSTASGSAATITGGASGSASRSGSGAGPSQTGSPGNGAAALAAPVVVSLGALIGAMLTVVA